MDRLSGTAGRESVVFGLAKFVIGEKQSFLKGKSQTFGLTPSPQLSENPTSEANPHAVRLWKCLCNPWFSLYAMGLIPKNLLCKGAFGRLKKYQTLSQIPYQNNHTPALRRGWLIHKDILEQGHVFGEFVVEPLDIKGWLSMLIRYGLTWKANRWRALDSQCFAYWLKSIPCCMLWRTGSLFRRFGAKVVCEGVYNGKNYFKKINNDIIGC